MGALDLPWKPTHEMIFIVGKGYSGERSGGVLRYQSIGPYQQARGERYHPTQKPIPLIVSLLEKSPIGIVYDPFLGSGTTLIACEKLGRRCRAVEISPAYVSVALERWSTMTGQTPTRLGAGGAGGA